MTPPEILTMLIWFAAGIPIGALIGLCLLVLGRAVARKRWSDPETHGDQGGAPAGWRGIDGKLQARHKALETGSSRPTLREW